MKLRKFIYEYLTFKRKERIALYTALCIPVIIYSLIEINLHVRLHRSSQSLNIDTLYQKLLSQTQFDTNKIDFQPYDSSLIINQFDPNYLSSDEWIKMGVDKNVADRIEKYLSKGGKFYKKDDLLKIYDFNESIYLKINPYIVFQNEQTSNEKKDVKPEDTINKEIVLYEFDPNLLSKEEWINFGVSERVANTITNYISKGGKFYKPEDVMKIYSFSKTDFERLKPYMKIQNVKEEKTTSNIIHKIDINNTSKSELMKFGFSSYNADGILNFKENAGGFYSKDQLYDIYKMDIAFLSTQIDFINVGNIELRKININSATFEDFEKHPYISEKTAQAIIDYRNETGNFVAISELKKVWGVIYNYEKLKPYLQL